jgi:hypothetical protein
MDIACTPAFLGGVKCWLQFVEGAPHRPIKRALLCGVDHRRGP